MKTINQTQLAEKLSAIKGAKPITFSAFINANAKKTGNPYSEVRKLSRVNGMTGANYEKSVNRQHEREGNAADFEARERSWGNRESPALVDLKGKKFLAIHVQSASKPVYFGRNAEGVLIQVKKDSIASFLPAKYSAAPAQGVEKEIVYRNYALENITQISIDGEKFRVRATDKSVKQKTVLKLSGNMRVIPLTNGEALHDDDIDEGPEGWDGHKVGFSE